MAVATTDNVEQVLRRQVEDLTARLERLAARHADLEARHERTVAAVKSALALS
jgi:chaperonin cofactor prefoldin